jgi:hypothetical protein
MDFPTPQEIAREAREALARNPETPEQTFQRLVRAGFINERGEVTKLLGGDVDPEPYAEIKGADSAKKKRGARGKDNGKRGKGVV